MVCSDFIFDTGAQHSCISNELLRKLGFYETDNMFKTTLFESDVYKKEGFELCRKPIYSSDGKIFTASGKSERAGKIDLGKISIGDYEFNAIETKNKFNFNYSVEPYISFKNILGMDVIQCFNTRQFFAVNNCYYLELILNAIGANYDDTSQSIVYNIEHSEQLHSSTDSIENEGAGIGQKNINFDEDAKALYF